ncbi:hypothetical protein SAMD00019534_042260 [Acytostelium subglobosum LB1]|uniref:hypothetical protein n=1 Tax=Acytostelium subglobosum LB1 TaxID=1410327 RepID=UPI0006449740|nr:hypothetical protein SAMD00019534_042260 [Acytostelium subglobosum LB1]GAM21051.1 hypothetical protein SAMD00019534_042260 [Acytostelium subglobosum LB1]|eukprot:XP_012756185.1 hypothetical protein SAMD00019534_042260 [Acytostelium subglobosum LB1]
MVFLCTLDAIQASEKHCNLQCPFGQVCCQPSLSVQPTCIDVCRFLRCGNGLQCYTNPQGQPRCGLPSGTSPVTTTSVSTGPASTTGVTTSAPPVTSSFPTTSTPPITTSEITTSAITTSDITTSELTTSEITSDITSQITTSELTTSEITSQITTSELTSQITTSELTSQITTSELTTSTPTTSTPTTSSSSQQSSSSSEPPRTFNLRGSIFNDTNGDGSNEGEPLLGGIKVVLTKDGNIVKEFITDASGSAEDQLSAHDLAEGSYCITVTDPNGLYAPGPKGTSNKLNGAGKYCFTLNKDTPAGPFDIYGGMIPVFTIRGHTYNDVNMDGALNLKRRFLRMINAEEYIGGINGLLTNSDTGLTFPFVTDDVDGYIIKNLIGGNYCLDLKDNLENWIVSVKGPNNPFDENGHYCFVLNIPSTSDAHELVLDEGLTSLYTVQGFSFNDTNNDGIFADPDTKIGGYAADLVQADGTVVFSFNTDATEGYKIARIGGGDYCLQFKFTPDQLKKLLVSPVATDNLFDKDGKYCFTLSPSTTTRHVLNASIGLYAPLFEIRGHAFLDTGKNGHDDGTDPLYNGIQMSLYDSAGALVKTVTTDKTLPRGENYKFTDLSPGDYCLKAVDPSGGGLIGPIGISNKFNSTGDYCFTLSTTEGSLVIDVGFVKPYSIHGFAFSDTDNNGDMTSTDAKISGIAGRVLDKNGEVVGNFVTSATGEYTVDNLGPGDYCIQLDLTQEQKDTFLISKEGTDSKFDKDGKRCFNIAEQNPIVNPVTEASIGLYSPVITLKGHAFDDLNEDGNDQGTDPLLGNITITLKFAANDSEIKSWVTDDKAARNEQYTYPISPGDYCLYAVDPKGRKVIGTKGTTNPFDDTGKYCFKVKAGDADPLIIDAGFDPVYMINGYIWDDKNQNGNFDAGEDKLDILTGTLTDKTTGATIGTVTSDVVNGYKFDPSTKLKAGDYCIKFNLTPEQKDRYLVSPVSGDNLFDKDASHCVSLTRAAPEVNIPIGIYVPTINLQGHAFDDVNEDGEFTTGESLLAASIVLQDAAGTVLKTWTTDPAAGPNKGFEYPLTPGKYCMNASTPNTDPAKIYYIGPMGKDNHFALDGTYCFTVRASDPNPLTVLAGFVPSFSISGFVWNDLDNNGNYLSTENKLDSFEGTLTDKTSGNVLDTFTSTSTSGFKLDKLKGGDYCIQFKLPQPVVPNKYVVSPVGTDNKYDATGKQCVTLARATPTATVPLGVYAPKFTIQGHVFDDVGDDGDDKGTDPLLGGMVVTLRDSKNAVLKSWTTVASDPRNKQFEMPDLEAGDYCLNVTDPTNKYHIGTKGVSNQFGPDGNYCFPIKPTDSSPVTVLAGMDPYYGITGFIWIDKDGNGNYVPEEVKTDILQGVISDSTGQPVGTFTSDKVTGFDLSAIRFKAGQYCIQFTLDSTQKDQYKISPIANDNKYDPTGKQCVILTRAAPVAAAPLGIYVPTFTVQGHAFDDLGDDGIDPGTDPLLSGILFTLRDSANTVLKTWTTDASGTRDKQFEYPGFVPGSYCLNATDTTGKRVIGTKGTSNVFDKDGNYCFIVKATDTDPITVHAGFDPIYGITGFEWIDTDKNGNYVNSETKTDILTGDLTDSTGAKVGTVTSDKVKGFDFGTTVFKAGQYCIQFNLSPDQLKKYKVSPIATDNKYDPTGKQCVTLTRDAPVNAAPIGIYEPTFTVQGHAFDDLASDGVDPGTDPLLDGILIKLTNMDTNTDVGSPVTTVSTSPRQQQFKYQDIPTGKYCLTASDPTGKREIGNPGTSNVFGKDGKYCFEVKATDTDPIVALVGFDPIYSITGFEFEDKNKDGKFDPTDEKIDILNGVVTDKATGSQVGTVTSDKVNGFNFGSTKFKEGIYCIKFNLSPEQMDKYIFSPTSGVDSKYDISGKQCVSLTRAAPVAAAPVGIYIPTYILQGHVFDDLGNDGVDPGTDPLLGDIVVTLRDSTNTVLKQWTTLAAAADRTKQFVYPDLAPGSYCLNATDPANKYHIGTKGTSNLFEQDGNYCFIVKATDTNPINVAAGFDPIYRITGFEFDDKDKNGNFAPTEDKLDIFTGDVTDSTGAKVGTVKSDKVDGFDFGTLQFKEGQYCIQFNLSQDQLAKYRVSPIATDNKYDATGKQCVTLTRAAPVFAAPLGVYEPTFTVKGHVFDDLGNDGNDPGTDPLLGSIAVKLTDTATNTVINTITTNAAAARTEQFQFPNLKTGSYCLNVTDPAGKHEIGTKGTSNVFNKDGNYCFTIKATDTDPIVVLAGMDPIYKISGFEWIDTDKDGNYLATEAKTDILNGVVIDQATNSQVGTVSSDEVTGFDFGTTKFKEGTYCIQFNLTPEQKNMYLISPIANDNKYDATGKQCVTLTRAAPVVNAPIGIYVPTINIAGHAFIDVAGDGTDQPATDSMLGGALITLRNNPSTGADLKSWTTSNQDARLKQYEYPLTPGDYCMTASTTSNEYKVGPTGPDSKFDPATGLYCFTIKATDTSPVPITVGFVKIQYQVLFNVYNDVNRDGIKDTSEPGLPSFRGSITRVSDGATVGAIDTDPVGNDVDPLSSSGDYCVQITFPQPAYGDVWDISPKTTTGNNFDNTAKYCFTADKATYPDGNIIVNLAVNKPPTKKTIQGEVFLDANANGIDDTETLLGGITVRLMEYNTELQKWTTDANGARDNQFSRPQQLGYYCVEVSDPSGTYVPGPKGPTTTDSQINSNGEYCFFLERNSPDPFIVRAGMVPKTVNP